MSAGVLDLHALVYINVASLSPQDGRGDEKSFEHAGSGFIGKVFLLPKRKWVGGMISGHTPPSHVPLVISGLRIFHAFVLPPGKRLKGHWRNSISA